MVDNKSVNWHSMLAFLISYAENNVPLAKQLLLVRTLHKKSQADLAKAAKCDQAGISAIESGKRNPTLKQIERYCEPLGLQVILVPRSLVPFISKLLRFFYTKEQQGIKNLE